MVELLRVCTNTACRRVGSLNTLDVLRNLAPPNVAVEACSCLGRCGSGPNLVLLPAQLMVSHCTTPAHAARLLEMQCGAAGADNNLAALALLQKAAKAADAGHLEEANDLYTQAIQRQPTGGLHSMLASRSACRLRLNDAQAALADAKSAAEIYPSWPQAYLAQADAYAGLGKYEAALQACALALGLDPSLRRSKSFQRRLLRFQAAQA